MIQTICSKLWILKNNLKEDARGVSALEYAILAAVIIGGLVAALEFLDFTNIFTKLNTTVTDAMDAATGD